MREATKNAVRFTTAPAWADYVISPVGLDPSTDASIESYLRDNVGTIFHPAGSAAMSPKGVSWGVVDPDLTVKGLTGLRVVDLSVTVSSSSASRNLHPDNNPLSRSFPPLIPRPRRMSLVNAPLM
jgi:choline dehydrogenase